MQVKWKNENYSSGRLFCKKEYVCICLPWVSIRGKERSFVGLRIQLNIRIIFFLLACTVQTVWAQQKHQLEIIRVDKGTTAVAELVDLPPDFRSKAEATTFLEKELLSRLQLKGYLAASIDSTVEMNFQTRVYLFLGQPYSWGQITIDTLGSFVDKPFFQTMAGLRGEPVSIQSVMALKELLLQQYEEHGYPFASIKLDSSYFLGDALYATLKASPGPLYTIDSIVVEGRLRIKTDFLERYLDVGAGSIYRKSILDQVSPKLAALGFLHESRPWGLNLLGTGSVLNLYLESKQSSRFNLLAGLMPSNQQVGGKLLLTGEAELDLRNSFGGGEQVFLSWQQLQVESPRLQVGFQKPYLFKSDAGVDFQFNLFRKDSSFLTLNTRIGLSYERNTRQTVKVFFQQFSSNLIDVDTMSIKQSKKLPTYLDLRTSNIGVDLLHNATDYRFNPRKGLEANLRLTGGIRKVLQNTTIVSLEKDPQGRPFDFRALYDTVKSSSSQFRLNARSAYYHPLGKQAVLKGGVQLGWLFADKPYLNELFQVGGIKTLRGFDEESLFASQFLIGTLEYRYLVAQNSYLFSFLDAAYIGRKTNAALERAVYAGAGFGLSFETKSGIFSLAYAAGKREAQTINFRESKIHFGFVSLF